MLSIRAFGRRVIGDFGKFTYFSKGNAKVIFKKKLFRYMQQLVSHLYVRRKDSRKNVWIHILI